MTFLEEKVAQLADSLTVISSVLLSRALALGVSREKMHLLPNGIDLDRVTRMPRRSARALLGIDEQDKVIVYEGGSTVFEDALVLLIRSFASLARVRPEAKLFLTFGHSGIQTETSGKIRQISALSGITDRVFLLPNIRIEALWMLLSAADILALPLSKAIASVAMVPQRLSDYLSAGRPLVVTDMGDVKLFKKRE